MLTQKGGRGFLRLDNCEKLGELPIEAEIAGPLIEQAPAKVQSTSALLAPGAHIIDRRPVGPVRFGDPPPRRSALAQRRAGTASARRLTLFLDLRPTLGPGRT